MTQLDAFLRRLLFDNCTVTRAIEDHALAKVNVRVEEQIHTLLPDGYAPLLEVPARSRAVRRRVAIKADGTTVSMLLAESFLIEERLPANFLASLATRAEGIGATLEDLQMPARRELVCWGLSELVPWRPWLQVGPVIVRIYRVVADALPAILIYEAFLIEAVGGQLFLANVASR